MKVALFFVQPEGRGPETPVHFLYGKYHVCGFMFIHATRVEAFCTWAGHEYTRFDWDRASHGGRFVAANHIDFMILSVDEDEGVKLMKTCEACERVKKPFNLRDLLLMYAPFREVEELAVDHAPTLNNTQAVIVMLRACLRTDNRLMEGLEGLHSRQTLMETLYNRLLPFALPVTWANITGLVQWPVEERQPDSKAMH